ncbi:MAG: NAD(P)H-hydrate dehydratase [Flavobacterium sp.]|nr:NAD(P)H-hydrate dehydratase [Pedobacter sp.]
MLNLLTTDQIRATDSITLKNQLVSSSDLMERAANAFVTAFTQTFTNPDDSISVYCGTGNNGGDGLAIARLLKEQGYERISVRIARFNLGSSADFETNLKRLELTGITAAQIEKDADLPEEDSDILIDALLGSGLNRPLGYAFKNLIEYLNSLKKIIVSVDLPSGFTSEGIIDQNAIVIKADLVISFQLPKINFFFPESATAVKQFKYLSIGLDEEFIQSQPVSWKLTEPADILKIIKPRHQFSHKGTYGHALIIAGNTETMGAALLCADACLHSGSGLTTACIPEEGLYALNSRSPEIMAILRYKNKILNLEFGKYQAVAIGPGIGKTEDDYIFLHYVIKNCTSKLVLDADALNIIAGKPDLLKLLPNKTILTPHLKEFDRLFGEHTNWWDRINTARQNAAAYQIVIVLKNRYTFIVLPAGDVIINPTGNPAMAVGGMGDVLTGIITSFLAQGFKPEDAAIAACYLHGKTGDIIYEKSRMHCIPPRYIINRLPKTIGSFIG